VRLEAGPPLAYATVTTKARNAEYPLFPLLSKGRDASRCRVPVSKARPRIDVSKLPTLWTKEERVRLRRDST